MREGLLDSSSDDTELGSDEEDEGEGIRERMILGTESFLFVSLLVIDEWRKLIAGHVPVGPPRSESELPNRR